MIIRIQNIFDSSKRKLCISHNIEPNHIHTMSYVSSLSLSLFERIFCFAYMVEGASGFGTPVALGAPMLISTGHPKFESVIVLLIFNTFATVWGAGKSIEEV
jgi:hypothetical protein